MLYVNKCAEGNLDRIVKTNEKGEYAFKDVPPGDYCLKPVITVQCGEYIPTTSVFQKVTVEPDEIVTVEWFGYVKFSTGTE